jgi:tape measure domain-containing protein
MAAPQLRLEVSLNLAGFRNEVRKLTQIAQSEFNPLLKVNVDTKDYRAQLKALERIKPVIKIEDSQLDAARARIGTLNKSLATLRRATSTPIEIKLKYTEIGKPPSAAAGQIGSAVSGRVRADQAVAVLNQKQAIAARNMLKAADVPVSGLGKSRSLEAYRKSIIDGMTNAGKESIAGLTQALKDGQSAIGQAAKIVGQEGIRAIKDTLGIASPSREFKKIGEAAGQGFEQGLLSSMADAFDSLERQLGTKLQRLKAQAIAGTSGALAVSGRVSPVQVADVTPRDYARIAGSGPRAALPPGVDRSAETLQNFYRSLDQIGIALASTVDSAERAADAFKTLRNAIDSLINRAKVLTGEQSLQARLRPSSVPGGMPLLTGRAPSRALPMLSAAAQRPERFTSQEKLFKDFLGRTIKAVVPESGSAAIGRSLFGGTQFREIGNAMRRPQLGAGIGTKVETVAVKDLTIASRNIAAATNALKAQKLLPAAGGTSASQMIRQALSGLPPLKAPQIGAQNISPRGSLGQFPMAGMMAPSSPLGSMGQFPVDPMLAVGGASAMGQKVAGPYPWSNTARSARGGYIPGIGSSLQFPMSGMMGPSSPLGRITPQSSMFAGGGGGGPGGGGPGGGGPGGGGGGPLGGMQFNVPQLPGSGLVREIGTEFAFAARQVLLFGTAYKALAFLQGFPGQVGNAVRALQSFRNTLGAISPSAAEAAASSQFILDVVDKYNTPIQSARDGFTKLYASMKPTGFSGDEIRDLFLGISQAAATFGMSADKVDRVNYAFAQMASKGQVMSEELKGQLGDVLPGAMGIFAEAAGFTGPEAITKFSKALEDGAYKGAAMKTLLTNVGSIMRKEFGPGAEGAARTFQGVMNRMQNSVKRFYETFEPVAVGFLNSVVMPLTSGIKTVTDGFNAFFTGANAKTAGGFAFAQELEKLRPTFEGLRTNAIALAQVFGEFAKVALGVGSALLQIAGNPIVGFMAKIYAIMVPLNMALGVMRGLWALNSLQLLLFNARVAMGVPTLSAFRGMMQATGATAAVTATSIRTAGLTLRTFFASTGVGLILVGISLLIERFMSMNQALADTRAKALGAAQAIRSMTKTEAILDERKTVKAIKLLETLQTRKRSYEGSTDVSLTKSEASLLEDVGVPVNKGGVGGGQYMDPTMLESHKQRLETVNLAELRNRQRVIENDENEAKQAAAITPITGLAGDGTGTGSAADKARQDAERLASQQQQDAINAANRQNALDKSRFEGLTALSEQAYRHEINLIDLVNEYRLNGLNSIEARQEKFQQDLQKIELKRIETVRKAQEQMQKAQLDYTAAQRTAGAAGAGSGNQAGGGAVFGDTGRTFNAKGWVHGHFQNMNKSALIEDTVDVVMKLLEQGVKPELSSGAAFGAGMGREQVTSLVRRGIESHKRYASGASAIDVFVPQGTPVPVPLSGVGDLGGAAGVTGSLARSTQLMHLDPKSKSGAARTMERRSAKAGGTAGVEQQDLLYKGMESGLSIINATTIALKERENLIAANINTIFPVAEQRLENDLMKMRNQLQLQGMPQEYIAFQEQQYKTTYEAAEAIKRKKQETMEYSKTVEALQAKQAQGKTLTSDEAESLRFYTEAIRQNDQALTDLIEKQRAYNIAALESAIASIKNADALKAQQDAIQLIDSNVESATGSYKNFIKEVAQGGDPAEALKKFQESITDQVLTVLLDYAFQPVEQFLKDSLKNMFGLPTEEKQRQETLAKLEAQLAKQERIAVATEQTATNTTPGAAAGTTQSPVAGSAFAPGGTLPAAAAGFDAASVFGNPEALTSAFAGIQSSISTSMEGITSSFQMGADSLANTLPSWSDALTTKLPAALNTSTNNTEGEIPAFQESLGKVASGIGIAAGAIMGIAAGISQIKKGGTGNTLMGIGSIMGSIGGAIGGFTKLAGANGGVAGGGWKPFPVSAFANGGMVKGPTLGLVGEGKYNEAIVPLPDGRSIPVQMRGGGGSGSRDLLANQAQSRPSPSVLSMSFQSTTINGVEYVDRAQLEAAMEETRRAASREGANKGANLAIDRLANSPSSRRRAGIR